MSAIDAHERVREVVITALDRPAPADDLSNPEDRVQAARELRDWTQFPYEVDVSYEDGDGKIIYGAEARAWLRAWISPILGLAEP